MSILSLEDIASRISKAAANVWELPGLLEQTLRLKYDTCIAIGGFLFGCFLKKFIFFFICLYILNVYDRLVLSRRFFPTASFMLKVISLVDLLWFYFNIWPELADIG